MKPDVNGTVDGKLVKTVIVNIVDMLNNNRVSDALTNPELRSLIVVWNNLQDIARHCPELLMRSDLELLTQPYHRSLNTILRDLTSRVIKNSIPTAVPVGTVSQPDDDENGWLPSHLCLIRVPSSIFDVTRLLLGMHWCVGNIDNVLPPNIHQRVDKTHKERLIKQHLITAGRWIATLATISPELWELLKTVYVATRSDERINWMYKNVYIQFISDFDCDNWGSQNVLGVYVGANRDTGSVNLSIINECFISLVDITMKVHSLLGGKSLYAYVDKILNNKGGINMNSSIKALEQLLRHSVVVTDSGEVLNVFINETGDCISITPRDLKDPAAQLDDRPKITTVKVLCDGVENTLIRTNEEDLAAIIESMNRFVMDPQHVMTQEETSQLDVASPVQHLIAEVQQQRHEMNIQAESRHTQVQQAVPQQQQPTQATATETPTPDVRINPNGDRLIRRVINGVEIWIPEVNIQTQEAQRAQAQGRPQQQDEHQLTGIHIVMAQHDDEQDDEGPDIGEDDVVDPDEFNEFNEPDVRATLTVDAQGTTEAIDRLFEITPDGRRVFRGVLGG